MKLLKCSNYVANTLAQQTSSSFEEKLTGVVLTNIRWGPLDVPAFLAGNKSWANS
jgi:hypothetical protein